MSAPSPSTPALSVDKVSKPQYACFGVTILAASIGAIYWASVLVTRNISEPQRTSVVEPFCCPQEAQRLFLIVNTSFDPCLGFYDYVCSGVTSIDKERAAMAMESLLESVRDDSDPQGHCRDGFNGLHGHCCAGPGLVLHTLYCSCLSAVRGGLSPLVTQIATSIAEEMAIKPKMTRAEVGKFLLDSSIKLHLDSFIATRPSGSFEPWLVDTNKVCPRCSMSVVSSLNNVLTAHITVEDLLHFESENMRDYNFTARLRDVSELADSLSVPVDVVVDAMSSTLYELNITEISVPSKSDLDSILNAFSIERLQPASIIYMVYCVARRVASNIFIPRVQVGRPPQGIKSTTCLAIARSMKNLVEEFIIQSLTNNIVDEIITDIYRLVEVSVLRTFISSPIFSSSDKSAVPKTLHRLQLVLLTNFSAESVSLPAMNHSDFGGNYIRSLSYESAAERVKRPRALPGLIEELDRDSMLYNGTFVHVLPSHYFSARFLEQKRLLFNLPVLGQGMAEAMWTYLLGLDQWSLETTAKLKNAHACFQEKYFKGQPNDFAVDALMHTMALESILRVVDKGEWSVRKHATGSWNLSNGQFFYIRLTERLCVHHSKDNGSVHLVDVIMRHFRDFRSTFSCPRSSAMAQKTGCSTLIFK